MAAKTRRAPARAGSPRANPRRRQRSEAVALRRSRVALLAGGVASALILAAWFPASALLHQHSALASVNSQLNQLRSQDQALAAEQKRLSSAAEVEKVARQEFQLIVPGQRAYEVLPPSGSSASSAYSGDPGNQAPAAPNGPLGTGSSPNASSSHPSGSGSSGLLGRITRTLEFWR